MISIENYAVSFFLLGNLSSHSKNDLLWPPTLSQSFNLLKSISSPGNDAALNSYRDLCSCMEWVAIFLWVLTSGGFSEIPSTLQRLSVAASCLESMEWDFFYGTTMLFRWSKPPLDMYFVRILCSPGLDYWQSYQLTQVMVAALSSWSNGGI